MRTIGTAIVSDDYLAVNAQRPTFLVSLTTLVFKFASPEPKPDISI